MAAHSRFFLLFILLACINLLLSPRVSGQNVQSPQDQATPSTQPPQKLVLNQATMCEKVENLTPIRPAVVFSVSAGQVCCFTSFDPVPQPTQIYHRWFHRDELSTQTRLRLYPPRWTTYSVIQLRETDKGPWRVEVSDQNGHVFDVFRFSITD